MLQGHLKERLYYLTSNCPLPQALMHPSIYLAFSNKSTTLIEEVEEKSKLNKASNCVRSNKITCEKICD